MKSTIVLTVILPSNYPNFGADSIFNFNRLLFRNLIQQEHMAVFVAGLPDMPFLGDRIRFLPFSGGTNKFEVRFSFPWDEMRQILGMVRPDVCFVNMPEQASAISILARDELRLDTRIVSYVHYIPAMLDIEDSNAPVIYESSMDRNGHGSVMLLRLLEGIAASDLVLTCSQFGIRLLRGIAARHLHDNVKLPPIEKLPPPVDLAELDSALPTNDTNEARFVYNHRLYDEYGTDKMFDLMERIAEKEVRPFKVLVTNPTEGRTKDRSKLNPTVDKNLARIRALPFVQQEHFCNRVPYIGALSSSWAGIAPLKPHALWSMSVMDVLACGRPVLAFDIAAFREMGLPDNLLVRNETDFEQAFRALLSGPPLLNERNTYRDIARQFECRGTADRFLRLVDGI